MFAAVELGSNSFRLHIGRYDGGAIHIVKSAHDPIRLCSGLGRDGNLSEQAMQTALQCLANFRTMLDEYTFDAVRVVATNTLPIAKNVNVFLPAAEQAIGHPIEVISGEEEGRLIYMGGESVLPVQDEKRLMIDIGGGSTELILGRGAEIRHVESFRIGTVQQNLLFFPKGRIDAASFDAAILSARSHFEDAAHLYHPQYWTGAYGSSETIRAISAVISSNGIGDGTLSCKNMEALKARLIEAGHTSRVNLAGIGPERIIVMIGGLAVLMGIMQELGIKSLTALEAGLEMGLLWDLQLRATKRDRREQSVQECMQRFHVDPDRASRAANIAAIFYKQLEPASDAHARYLNWSVLLHEIGLVVSHTNYHKHAAYLVENADLPGFTTSEQKLMSTLVLAQKGNLRKVRGELAEPDFAKAVLALRLAIMSMHSKIDAEPNELRLKMKSKIEVEVRRDWLEQHPTVSYWLKKERDWWDEIGVDLGLRAI